MKKMLSLVLAATASAAAAFAQNPLPEIDEILKPYIDAGELPGMVTVVATAEKVLHVNTLGWENIERGKPMTDKSLFWIASQSKPFAGVAVMMLVEEGKLDLDAPVYDYIPELKEWYITREKRDNWRIEEKIAVGITLRQLLSHTGGMHFLTDMNARPGKIDIIPLRTAASAALLTPLEHEPGTAYLYSNQGINIAAAVVEQVSGMPYETFLQTRLFDPLGMSSATFWPTSRALKKLATPYRTGPGGKLEQTRISQLTYPLDGPGRYCEAGGGLFCTPVDLVKFYRMLAGGGVFEGRRYLSSASVAELGKKQTPEGVEASYGLGFNTSNGRVGHGGAYGTDSFYLPASGLIVMFYIQEEGLPKKGEAIGKYHRLVLEKFR
jgi:CubicO group peptidase (beta-lactamase class C family)